MSGVPYVFGNATTSIPLSQLDVNFATPATLGNTTVGLGNTITTIGNLTVSNISIVSTNGDANVHGLTVGQGANSVSTNTVVGYNALSNAANTGGKNTVYGYTSMVSNTSGSDNTAIGKDTLQANTTGGTNIAVGEQSLYSNTTTSNNTAVGYQAGYSNTASGNTYFGYQAGYSNTGSGYVTCVGNLAGYSTTSSNFTAVGQAAGQYTTGNGVFLGSFAGQGVNGSTSGGNNTAVGISALAVFTTGFNNTIVGKSSGAYISSGYNNTCVGTGAGGTSTNLTTGYNNTLIGYGADTSSSASNNQIVLCASGTTGKGDSTGFINPNGGGVYQGNNSTLWSVTSDERLKKNIVDNTVGLSAITQIKVRNFEYRLPDEITDLDKSNAVPITGVQLGPIAQEIQQVLPDCVKTESTGVMSVDSSDVLWHLVTAVQQLSAQVTTQAAEIAALQAKVGA